MQSATTVRASGEAVGPARSQQRAAERRNAVDVYWIPLGAGGHCVRFNGEVFEAIGAARRHRARCDLYHAALIVALDGETYTIELAPSPDGDEASRGVVATGAVGSRLIGCWRLFRYEVRCWAGGTIPDLAYAVGGPHRLTTDARAARRLLAAVPNVPTPVWGRDELRTGEMWNSNSLISWSLATAGFAADRLHPPPHGRAPGWRAGLAVAARSIAPRRDIAHPGQAGHRRTPARRPDRGWFLGPRTREGREHATAARGLRRPDRVTRPGPGSPLEP